MHGPGLLVINAKVSSEHPQNFGFLTSSLQDPTTTTTHPIFLSTPRSKSPFKSIDLLRSIYDTSSPSHRSPHTTIAPQLFLDVKANNSDFVVKSPNMSDDEVQVETGYSVLPKDVQEEIGSVKLFNKVRDLRTTGEDGLECALLGPA